MSEHVVFLHGIGAGADSFRWLAPLVPGSVALDMPGFGDEPWRGPASFAGLSQWLADKLDAMDAAPAVLFGHSFGGMLALETAVRHPEKVRALVLCATTPAFGGRDPAFAEKFLEDRLGPLDRGMSMAELARESAAAMAGEGAPPDRVARFAESMGRVPEEVFRDIVRCLTTFDRRADLSEIEAPALVIAGLQDPVAPPRTMRRMADALPHARYREFPAGHLLPVEKAETLAQALKEFLVSLEDDRP